MRFVSTALLFLTTALSAQIVPPGDAGAPRIASNGTNLLVGWRSANGPCAWDGREWLIAFQEHVFGGKTTLDHDQALGMRLTYEGERSSGV